MGGKAKPIDFLTGGLTYVGRGIRDTFQGPDTSDLDAMYNQQAKDSEKNLQQMRHKARQQLYASNPSLRRQQSGSVPGLGSVLDVDKDTLG